jgi:hypothetical protein
MDKIDIDGGKYSIVIGNDNGKWIFKALRYDEEWIENLTATDGSNMIMAMAYEIQSLRNEVLNLNNELILSKNINMFSNISGLDYETSKDLINNTIDTYKTE